MSKLIITRWKQYILTALLSGYEAVELSAYLAGEEETLGNIYIGKVKKIVKNINSAFVEYSAGRMGYYSLSENNRHIYARPEGQRALKEGDEIVVQVIKEAVKTKDPVLSATLSFTGKYTVLTYGKGTIGFSQKLPKNEEWKQSIKTLLEKERLRLEQGEGEKLEESTKLGESAGPEESTKPGESATPDLACGVIVRTNAAGATTEQIVAETRRLRQHCHQVLAVSPYRTPFSLLYHSPPGFVRQVLDSYTSELEAVVTDQADLYSELRAGMEETQPEDLGKLSYYADPQVNLFQLYRIQRAIDEAIGKQVWLKSGGYLVIEPTEALTVIDVNTGKYAGKKNQEDTLLKINLEAAEEIARQLRLRNLTGIIVIDFIDMKKEENRKELLRALSRKTALDPVKTTVVDMTALNLVEVTRKKGKRPLAEQLREKNR